MPKFVCIQECYWDLRVWREGEVYEGDRIPPKHFSGGANARAKPKSDPPAAVPPADTGADIFG